EVPRRADAPPPTENADPQAAAISERPVLEKPALEIDGLIVKDAAGATRLDVSLSVRRGEIVGLAGVEGNGQSQLGAVLAGLLAPASGRLRVGGTDVTGWPPRAL